MGRRVVALSFPTSHEAHEALERVLDLQRDKVIVVHDAVVVSRSEDGALELDEPADVTAVAIAVPAILLGAFVGTLLAGPLGFLAGALFVGTLGIAFAKWLDQGISDRTLAQLERRARPGQSVLAMQLGTADAAELDRRIPMKHLLTGIVVVAAASTSVRADDQPFSDPNAPSNDEPTVQLPAPAPPQPTPPPAPAPQEIDLNVHSTPVLLPADTRAWYDPNRIGFGITAGGGVAGFVGDTMRSTTQDGGNWDVRLMIGTRLPIALEASYLGSAQKINALGLDNNALLVGNGFQGNVRLNATTDMPVQPFAYGGIAWRRYTLENSSSNTSDVSNRDDVLEVPVGLGVAYKLGTFMLDARAEYRGSFNENLVPDGPSSFDAFTDPASLTRWGVNANVGFEF